MAQQIPKSAAASIYPHLPSVAPAPVQRQQPQLADALFPSLSREQKAKEAAQRREAKQREGDQRLWDAINKRARDNFLKAWRAERKR
jgi:hypothetical protein